jgi:two-component system chemotaxis sensor kinase CheA
VERAGDRDVVQYRGDIMPLLYLGDLFGAGRPAADRETLEVVVYTDQGRSVGVVVDHVVDIVEETIQIKTATHRSGIIGNTVLQGKVTELLDVEQVIRQGDPEFFNQALAPAV